MALDILNKIAQAYRNASAPRTKKEAKTSIQAEQDALNAEELAPKRMQPTPKPALMDETAGVGMVKKNRYK